ncbi:hypothetical protein AeRB84_006291 [Aphanomyces euteiches]|nr:hypothetical protein AeRB84_006291 [Aphanomyces euteiches]
MQQLQLFLALYHASPLFRKTYHFLPQLYEHVRSRRYLVQRGVISKIGQWTVNRLACLDSVRVTRDVRMPIDTFNYIVSVLRLNSVFKNQFGPTQSPIELQLQVYLHYMATSGVGGSYYVIGQHFGIVEGTVRKFIMRVLGALHDHLFEFVSWPNTRERHDISLNIEAKCGLRGAGGIIDGTCFELKYKPQEEHETYFNRKSRYAIGGQIISDDRRRIRACMIGFPSSVHDSRQHKSMAIALEPTRFFSDGEFLLGDSAYALNKHLIRPYKAAKSKIKENKKLNYHFSAMRMTIEHCIGMVKSRFTRLRDGFFTILRDAECHDAVIRMIVYV